MEEARSLLRRCSGLDFQTALPPSADSVIKVCVCVCPGCQRLVRRGGGPGVVVFAGGGGGRKGGMGCNFYCPCDVSLMLVPL